MLCHMRIDLSVLLCTRSDEWTRLVQRNDSREGKVLLS